MSSATVNGLTIEYDIHGEGEPLVLVMGLATQMIAWSQPFVDRLVGHGFQVVRLDNRDIGRSAKTGGPAPSRHDVLRSMLSRRLARSDYLLADMAGDVVGVLDHLGIGRAHVVGASMGGMIAQEVVINHPERVRSLTSIMSNTGDRRHGTPAPSMLPALRRSLVAPPPTTREEAIDRGVEAFRVIGGPLFSDHDVRAMVTEAVGHSDDVVGRVRQLLAINASPDRTAGLRRVTVPTLVVHGLLDRLVRPSGGIATCRAVAGSRLLMFPDMAHDLPIPRRIELADAIAENARRAG